MAEREYPRQLQYSQSWGTRCHLNNRCLLTGWVCVIGQSRTKGLWSKDESPKHINYLELQAVYLSLKSFVHLVADKHVKVLMITRLTSNVGSLVPLLSGRLML